MAVWKFAKLRSPQDYETLRSLPNNDFPNTFDKFTYMQTREFNKYRLEWPGSVVTETEVDVGEFVKYCDSMKANYTFDRLNEFARKKICDEKN